MDSEGVSVERNVLIPMRDGLCLAADLYRPSGAGPWPAVASCYPYHKDGMIGATFAAALKGFARHGYAALLVDCRGTGSSDGVGTDALEPIATMDLYDLVEWIGGRSWCTGKVGMWGISYGGVTALKAATLRPPHLAAIAPIYGLTDFYRTWLVPGGRPNLLGSMGAWMSFMQAMNLAPPLWRDPEGRWRSLWAKRLEGFVPYLIDGLDHLEANDPYWDGRTLDPGRITVPTLVIAGWRDVFLADCLEQYRRATGPKRLLVGPWVHMLPNVSVLEALDYEWEIRRWFDYWLKGDETGVMAEPPVRVFVQGEGGGWRFDADFPPAGTPRRLFPRPGGALDATGPEPGRDRRPVLHSVGVTSGLWSPMPMGLDYPQDQRRDDALSLTYTSAPLAEPLEIAGRPVVRLAVTPTWDDPTLVAKLCDVAPDGASGLVTTGCLALRAAAGAPRGAVAGRPHEVEIALWPTAYRFAPGHRVRLSVACADFPRLWPSEGTGEIELERAGCELRLPAVSPDRPPGGTPRFAPPDLTALLSEGPVVFVPRWSVEADVVAGTVATKAGLEMRLTTPAGAGLEMRHAYVARVGTGERAEPTVDAACTLEVTQEGDAVTVDAAQHMTARAVDLTSSITVNGAQRFHRHWRRTWRSP
jgi:putative CocE/NonD family hydrolase